MSLYPRDLDLELDIASLFAVLLVVSVAPKLG